MANVADIIAGIVKGAAQAGAAVEVAADRGHEVKLAGAGGAIGGAFGPVPAALLAGLQDRSVAGAFGGGAGSLLGGVGGATAGGLGGAGIGALYGHLAGEDVVDSAAMGARLGIPIGALAGSAYGGHRGQNHMRPEEGRAVTAAYRTGQQNAKHAFLGAAASMLAPTLARGALGKVAPKALGAISKPLASAAFDTGTSMAAQKALG